jgi:hypothetical protein
MNLEQLEPGDLVYATSHIYNDGGIPDIAETALLAEPGTRGVIILESAVGRVEGYVHGGVEQGSLLRILRPRHWYFPVRHTPKTRIKSPGAI